MKYQVSCSLRKQLCIFLTRERNKCPVLLGLFPFYRGKLYARTTGYFSLYTLKYSPYGNTFQISYVVC
jgi:hypothetical protein